MLIFQSPTFTKSFPRLSYKAYFWKDQKHFSLPIPPLVNIAPSLLHPAILFQANSAATVEKTTPTAQAMNNFSNAESVSDTAKLLYNTYSNSGTRAGPNAQLIWDGTDSSHSNVEYVCPKKENQPTNNRHRISTHRWIASYKIEDLYDIIFSVILVLPISFGKTFSVILFSWLSAVTCVTQTHVNIFFHETRLSNYHRHLCFTCHLSQIIESRTLQTLDFRHKKYRIIEHDKKYAKNIHSKDKKKQTKNQVMKHGKKSSLKSCFITQVIEY